MTQVSRMAVNAAIEQLVARSDESGEAARTVIAYGHTLKKAGKLKIILSSNTTTSGDSISGHTAEHGEVSIEEPEHQEHKEWAYGINKDRVGHYRLWKEGDGLLIFHHFWKSTITTQGPDDEDPEEYHLAYDPGSLEPNYLGVERKRVVLALGRYFVISRRYLEPIYGTIEKPGLGFGVEMR